MERLTEVNALTRASHARLREVIATANRMENRKRIVNDANTWLLQRHAPNLLETEEHPTA